MMREAFSCDDVLLVPRFSNLESRSECDVSLGSYSLPIISSPMDTVYSKELDRLLTKSNMIVTVHRYFKGFKEQIEAVGEASSNDNRFFSVGSIPKSQEWIDGLLNLGIKHFLIDMAHGDSSACVRTIEYIKSKIGDGGKIIAGNVATKSGFRRLEEAGAWGVRVGLGSGSICSTRQNTGFGVPLLTSVEDCELVRDSAYIIADGGMKYPGDIAKAIACGADFAMMGRMFASTDLGPGDCYDKNKELVCPYNEIDLGDNRSKVAYKHYRGMASSEAREGVLKKASIEGVSGLVKYTGTTEDFVENLSLNMKASLSYAGSVNWKEFKRNTKKMHISSASLAESGTHVE